MSRTTRRAFLLLGGTATLGTGGYIYLRNRPTREAADSYHGPEPDDVGVPGNSGQQTCRTPENLISFDHVGSGLLGYEITGNPTPMRADPRFVELLDAWAEDWAKLSGLGAITELWSSGAYTDKCNSYHQAGRAIDIARVIHESGGVSCRVDQWNPGTASQLRDYWRLAASLHAYFAYTLTHLYNPRHNNHIHVDNSVNSYEPTTFDPESRVQVQLIQASLRHVHGQDVQPTDTWDSQTREALKEVQKRLAITRPVADTDGWQSYLRATAAG